MSRVLPRLVWFHAGHMVRHPLVWLATAGAIVVVVDLDPLPTWLAVTERLAVAGALVGCGVLVPAMAIAMREVRHPPPGAFPVTAPQRVGALLGAAALTALACCAVMHAGAIAALWASTPGIAGPVPLLALPLSPLAAMVGGVLGVLVGTWIRSWAMVVWPWGGVAGVVAVALWAEILPADPVVEVCARFLSPAAVYSGDRWLLAPAPLAFLALVLAAGAAATMLRLQSGIGRRVVTAGLATVLLIGAAGSLDGQSDALNETPAQRVQSGWPLAASAPLDEASGQPECRDRDGVEYCAYPGYEQWVPLWADAVRPVARAVPRDARDDLPKVVQRTDAQWDRDDVSGRRLGDGAATPSSEWTVSDPSTTEYGESDLATQVALAVLDAPDADRTCTLEGQARASLLYWLVTQTREANHMALSTSLHGFLEEARPHDIAVGVAMARAPDRDIGRGLERHWRRLLSPDTSPTQAAELLDVHVSGADDREGARLWRDLVGEPSGEPQCR